MPYLSNCTLHSYSAFKCWQNILSGVHTFCASKRTVNRQNKNKKQKYCWILYENISLKIFDFNLHVNFMSEQKKNVCDATPQANYSQLSDAVSFRFLRRFKRCRKKQRVTEKKLNFDFAHFIVVGCRYIHRRAHCYTIFHAENGNNICIIMKKKSSSSVNVELWATYKFSMKFSYEHEQTWHDLLCTEFKSQH